MKHIIATKSHPGFIDEGNRRSGGSIRVNYREEVKGGLSQSKDPVTLLRIK